MENLELVSFEIISNVGTARSMYVEAIQEAKKGNFDKAEEMIKEGQEIFKVGHKAHFELVTKMAQGEVIPVDLLLMHAEDQMMGTEMFLLVATELIELYKNK